MKISIIVAGMALFIFGCASDSHLKSSKEVAGRGEEGFRGVSWGSEKEEVKKFEEKGTPVSSASADELMYDGKLLGKIPVKITYHFEEGKLRRGTYQVVRSESVMEYTLFQIILSRKYGSPYQHSEVPDMIETNWLTPETEIDLLADGSQMTSYSLKKPEVSRAVQISSIKLNYYDRSWFARSMEKTVKEEASLNESETYYQKLIGDWVQLFPSFRSCVGYDPFLFPGDPMFLPEDEYVYEPGSSDSDF
ncbi:MAG: hypothetical protein U9N73_11405 [Candidatus Auribacterota bacterium]|nr:hypothetical protein [Candidatus Auribacterota bacterium]